MVYRLGVDLGATKVRATIFANKKVLLSKKVLHEGQILPKICEAINKVLSPYAGRKISSIGLAVPGVVVDNVVVTSPNEPAILQVDLAKELSRRYKTTVTLINDADAFVLGAHRFHQPRKRKEAQPIVGLTFGTGLGVGILVHNQILRNAGELGQFSFSLDKLPKHMSKIEHHVNGKAFNSLPESVYAQHVADVFELIHRAYLPRIIYVGGSLLRLKGMLGKAKSKLKAYEQSHKAVSAEYPFEIVQAEKHAVTYGAMLVGAMRNRKRKY